MFKNTVILCLSFFIGLMSSQKVSARVMPFIVGGTEAQPGEFPFIVSLQERGSHICGGSLISKSWVLTAGHCVTGTRISRVIVGLHDQSDMIAAEKHAVKRIIRHYSYDNVTTDYDFALIELRTESAYPPISLNRAELAISEDPAQRTMSTTAGWGETGASAVLGLASRLQKVDVPLVTAQTCANAYPAGLTERMMCAGFPEGKLDACYGDSGGPLIVRDSANVATLVGVVSWGEGCARPNKYGVYSKVSSVVDWIDHTMAN